MLLSEQTRWDQYFHIPWISRKDCCLQMEVYHFSCTTGALHCQAASSRWDIVISHRVLRRYYIVPHVEWVAGRYRPVAFWMVSRFSQDLDDVQGGPVSEYVCGFVPRARFCPDRSHGCCGTYHRHRDQCTDPLCPSMDVASED